MENNDAISRSAALEKPCDGCNSRNNTPVPRCGNICSDFKEILKLPTIDAVPVVRCGDCKWYDSAFFVCSKCGVCVNRDFFCADGEKEQK